jgi:hypothetical protein
MTIRRMPEVYLGSALAPGEADSTSASNYKGTWDASTNTPTLVNGVGEAGDYYIVSVAGTVDFGDGDITFAVNDYVVYTGTSWVVQTNIASISRDITANVDVGGVQSGRFFPSGTNMTDMFEAILTKYFPPTITISANKTLLNKKGTTVSQPIVITAKSTKKTDPIVRTAITYGGSEVASGTNPNGETITYTHTTDISTDTTFGASVYDGKQTVTGSVKFEFVVPFYWGVSNSNVVSSLTGLTEKVEKKGNKVVTLSPNNQYVIFMYDSSYGNLSKIIDPNGFDITPSFNRSEVTIDGQTYKCYVSNDKSTNTNFKYTFNF